MASRQQLEARWGAPVGPLARGSLVEMGDTKVFLVACPPATVLILIVEPDAIPRLVRLARVPVPTFLFEAILPPATAPDGH